MSDTQQDQNKLSFFQGVFGGLSFIPFFGIPFGLISILWGLLSKKRDSRKLIGIGALGIGFTVALSIVLYNNLERFGFFQQDGANDSFIEAEMAHGNISSLVQAIEFYKLQNNVYPLNLTEVSMYNAQQGLPPVYRYDPTAPTVLFGGPASFYYEPTADRSGYYLLGVGTDGKPFTSDDLLPAEIGMKNIGLLINPASKPTP